MAGKSFLTSFVIAAKYTGQAAFRAFNRDIDHTQRNAKQMGTSFTKVFGGIISSIGLASAAYMAFRKTFDLGTAAFEAAKDVRAANDIVRQANAKLVKEGRLRSDELEKQTKDTIDLAEKLSKLGLDAEDLQGGLAGLSRAFSSKQIEQMSKGWMDWMVTIHKGAPTQEQMIEDAKKLEDFVMKGKAKSLDALGITKEQIAAWNKQTKGMSAQQAIQYRGAQIAKLLGKETGALAEWKKTDAGATYAMNQAAEDNLEIIGKPMADNMRALVDASTELLNSLKPVSELIAAELGPHLQNLAKWMVDNKESIIAFAKGAVEWLAIKFDQLIVSVQDTYAQMKWLWEFFAKVIEDNKAAWKVFTDSFSTDGAAAWEKLKAVWGEIATWFDANVIQPIYGAWNWLTGNSYLVDAAASGWESIKGIWNQISGWFNENVIQPVANMWAGLNAGMAGAQLPTATSGGARQPGDYVAPWQQTGGGGGTGQGSGAPGVGGGATGAGGGEPGTTGPNAAIAAERVRAIEELKDPETRKLVAATMAQEMGSASGRADVLESLVNRSVVTGKSLRSLIEGGGRKGSFYGPYRRGEVQAAMAKGMSPAAMQEFDKIAGEVGAGRNRIRGMTDQGMINEIRGEKHNVGGEYYGMMGHKGERATAAYRAGIGQRVGPPPLAPGPLATPTTPTPSLKDMIKPISATPPGGQQNVTMNPTINVQGVAAGSEDKVAKRIQSVVQDNSKELLSQLKRAKDDEARLGYV